MPPQLLRLPLRGTRAETPSVSTFQFDLGGRTLDYQPGQYASLKLDGVEGPPGAATRSFTLSSSPSEAGSLAITTRIRRGHPFKERLAALREGEEVEVRAPWGSSPWTAAARR